MPEARDLPSSSQALVPLVPRPKPQDTPRRAPVRRAAPFLTQLIAASERLPQAREKRRAEPADVIAAYRTIASRLGPSNDQ